MLGDKITLVNFGCLGSFINFMVFINMHNGKVDESYIKAIQVRDRLIKSIQT